MILSITSQLPRLLTVAHISEEEHQNAEQTQNNFCQWGKILLTGAWPKV